MQVFRGYVSRAQEGILSENPSAGEYDRVPVQSMGEMKARASRPVLPPELGEDGDRTAAEQRSVILTSETDAAPDPEADSAEKDQARAQVQESPVPVESVDALPEQEAPKGIRRFFTLRVLLLAVLVNLLLGALLAFVMYLDRPAKPIYVYYIDLVDTPAQNETGGGAQPEAPEAPASLDSGANLDSGAREEKR